MRDLPIEIEPLSPGAGDQPVKGNDVLDWEALVPRLVHPTKVWIIEAMRWIDRPLSASELAKVFAGKLSVSVISYHVKTLAECGVVVRMKKQRVRGAWKTSFAFSPAVVKR